MKSHLTTVSSYSFYLGFPDFLPFFYWCALTWCQDGCLKCISFLQWQNWYSKYRALLPKLAGWFLFVLQTSATICPRWRCARAARAATVTCTTGRRVCGATAWPPTPPADADPVTGPERSLASPNRCPTTEDRWENLSRHGHYQFLKSVAKL